MHDLANRPRIDTAQLAIDTQEILDLVAELEKRLDALQLTLAVLVLPTPENLLNEGIGA